MNGNEIELKDYLRSLWKRKWLVLGLTLGAVLAAMAINLIVPLERSIESVIQADLPTELKVNVKELVNAINRSSGSGSLPAILKMSPRRFPSVRAETDPDSSRFRIVIRSKDIPGAKKLLKAIVGHLNTRFQGRWRKMNPEKEGPNFFQILSETESSRPFFGSKKWPIFFAGIFGFLFSTLLAYLLDCLREKRKTELSSHG